MKELNEILEETGLEVYRQGSMMENEEYPDCFMTWWKYDEDEIYYDNRKVKVVHKYWVYVYANDPERLEETKKNIREKLEKEGIVIKKGFINVASDEQTHIGEMITVCLCEKMEVEK